MKITTLEYNANQPIAKAMTVPLASKYMVGLKVSKDGQFVDCKMDELTVDGVSASTQIAGYNIYELSSDGTAGMKQLGIKLQKRPTTDCQVSYIEERVFKKNSNVSITTNLSSYDLPETITLTPFSLSGSSSYISDAGEVKTISLIKDPTAANYFMTPTVRVFGLSDMQHSAYRDYTFSGLSGWRWFADAERGQVYESSITVPTAMTTIRQSPLIYRDNTITAQLSVNLSFNTNDGTNADFQLQVSQKDAGYLEYAESNGSSGDSYSKTETSSAVEISTALENAWQKDDAELSAKILVSKNVITDSHQGAPGLYQVGIGNGLIEATIKADADDYAQKAAFTPMGILWSLATLEPDPEPGMFMLSPPQVQHGQYDMGTVATREWVLEQLAALSAQTNGN